MRGTTCCRTTPNSRLPPGARSSSMNSFISSSACLDLSFSFFLSCKSIRSSRINQRHGRNSGSASRCCCLITSVYSYRSSAAHITSLSSSASLMTGTPCPAGENTAHFMRVTLESDLSFGSHVKAVMKTAHYHLKNMARISCFVSSEDLKNLVHAFDKSRVGYCNVLLTCPPKKTIYKEYVEMRNISIN